jgi:hypothetical protein
LGLETETLFKNNVKIKIPRYLEIFATADDDWRHD